MATNRTANDLVKDVLMLLNVVNPSETPTDADAQTVLDVIQDVLAEWSTAGLIVPFATTETFNLTASQASYSVGEYGTPSKSTVRPNLVTSAWIRSGDSDYPIKIIGEREYSGLFYKSGEGRPENLWVNYEAPNAYFYLYPVPDSAYTFYFVSIKPFTEPTALTTSLLNTSEIPREYYNALKHNVAVDVGVYFEKPPNPVIMQRAKETFGRLVSTNMARTLESAKLEISGTQVVGDILSYA